MNDVPIFLASFHGRPVTVHHANHAELKVLSRPLDPASARDVLSVWSLVAIRHASGLAPDIHALGWREREQNTWITSRLVGVDMEASVVETRSGHAYRLGVPDDMELDPELRGHLGYALVTWGFSDVRS